jgi:hypothetical protein
MRGRRVERNGTRGSGNPPLCLLLIKRHCQYPVCTTSDERMSWKGFGRKRVAIRELLCEGLKSLSQDSDCRGRNSITERHRYANLLGASVSRPRRQCEARKLSAAKCGRGLACCDKIPGTHFRLRLSQPLGHSVTRKIRSMEKSYDLLIGNRTTNLLACSIVPQPTMLLCAPITTQ